MLLNPVTYISKHKVKARGIRAELLPEICQVWLLAREKGALTEKQEETASKAEIGGGLNFLKTVRVEDITNCEIVV